MVNVNLKPVAKTEAAMLSYLDINFRRIADVLASLADVEQGVVSVTGSVNIDTGLSEVLNCFVGFNGAPSSNAAFLRAYPRGAAYPKQITIEVYTSSFAASTTPVNVAWYVIGGKG